MPRIEIEYESDGFAAGGSVSNGPGVLVTNWDDLLWAALTVGRPNRQYVFQHGMASMYEALFRLSLVRMALEQSGPTAYRLRRTTAAKTLDPSEKGAVNYFLGLAICKLFADKLLQAPWLLHLDVYRPQLNVVLTGRSRPDLVGEFTTGGWLSLECKGRVSTPSNEDKIKAKEQAERLVSVNGTPPLLHVGAVAYFRGDVLRFYWRDPPPAANPPRRPIEVSADETVWRYYYQPVLDLIHSQPAALDRMLNKAALVPVDGLDIQVGILPRVLHFLEEGDWATARHFAREGMEESDNAGYHADGIRVVAGPTWLRPFDEHEAGI
jgi:hypothetical protein